MILAGLAFFIGLCRFTPLSSCFTIYMNSVKVRFWNIKYCSCHVFVVLGFAPNSSPRFVAASTASINAFLTPNFSSLAIPAIVVPPGEQTESFRVPG